MQLQPKEDLMLRFMVYTCLLMLLAGAYLAVLAIGAVTQ